MVSKSVDSSFFGYRTHLALTEERIIRRLWSRQEKKATVTKGRHLSGETEQVSLIFLQKSQITGKTEVLQWPPEMERAFLYK